MAREIITEPSFPEVSNKAVDEIADVILEEESEEEEAKLRG